MSAGLYLVHKLLPNKSIPPTRSDVPKTDPVHTENRQSLPDSTVAGPNRYRYPQALTNPSPSNGANAHSNGGGLASTDPGLQQSCFPQIPRLGSSQSTASPNNEALQPGAEGVSTRDVFELIQMLPLFLSGLLASPSHASWRN